MYVEKLVEQTQTIKISSLLATSGGHERPDLFSIWF